MAANELNQQTIHGSGQSYKSLLFTEISRIDAYFQKSNGAIAWNNHQYLGSSFLINGSTSISFLFANSKALSNSDFFCSARWFHTLWSNFLSECSKNRHAQSICKDENSRKCHFCRGTRNWKTVGTIWLVINSLTSTSEGSISDVTEMFEVTVLQIKILFFLHVPKAYHFLLARMDYLKTTTEHILLIQQWYMRLTCTKSWTSNGATWFWFS